MKMDKIAEHEQTNAVAVCFSSAPSLADPSTGVIEANMASAEDNGQVNVFRFRDNYLKVTPDEYQDYPDAPRESKVPLIIDNGAYNCKVGWANDSHPRMQFKNVIAKQRGKKDADIQIGNDITNIEVVRWLLKTQFDRNVVVHYEAQELIFDYIFSHLGIKTQGSIDHPIIMTEPVCNPNYCRQLMSELLFECYHVPQIAYGVDSLFSFQYNMPQAAKSTGIVLSSGYQTTHVLPVINGRLDSTNCKRINIGGAQATTFMHRLLQLKYPAHFGAITLSRAEELVNEHTFMAEDYATELEKWNSLEYYHENVHKIQLPYTPIPGSTLSAKDKEERRQQQIKRLQEMNAKRRESKLAADQEKLEQLMSIQELIEDEDEDTFNRALEKFGYSSAEECQAAINKLNLSIQKTREKILGIEPADDSNNQEPCKEEPTFDLLDIPDEAMTLEQKEEKRRQKILKSAHEARLKAKRLREELKAQQEEEQKVMEAKRQLDLESWLADIRQQRQELLENRSQRQQQKTELAKRKSQASQERMRILTQLAHEGQAKGGSGKGKEDTFGQNDEDWNVYKTINKEGGDSDSEAEQEKLAELEQLLAEYDPEFQKETPAQQQVGMVFDIAEYYQLHLGVERIRVPELLFQPSMMGIDQAGLAETLQYVLSRYPPDVQNTLVQTIFLTGGNTLYPNLKTRLETELLAMRPFQSTFKVYTANDALLDSWYGARNWALTPQCKTYYITKAEYDEKGAEYLKEHHASNRYIPNPK
ncbi:actin-related protein 5-like isoform X2 [Ptychodera flava]|uniref:actin-related protein 5-like isoform X2 n=1 Tax=Ptychodera flava TaxID=63121 RepID=UPI00396A24B2